MTHEIKNLISLFIEQNESWQHFLIKNWKEIIGNLHNKVELIQITQNTLLLGVHDSSGCTNYPYVFFTYQTN